MKRVWQIVGGVFLSLLILVGLALAGYGGYKLVDDYLLTKPSEEQTEKEKAPTTNEAGEKELAVAEANVQNAVA